MKKTIIAFWLFALFSMSMTLAFCPISADACCESHYCSSAVSGEGPDNVRMEIDGNNNIVNNNIINTVISSEDASGSTPIYNPSFELFPAEFKFVIPLPWLYFLNRLRKKRKSKNQNNNNENNNDNKDQKEK